MKAGRRLIQNVNCLTGTALAQLCRQLDSLCFTAGQLGGRLAQTDIGKSHVIERLNLPVDRRNIFKKLQCLFHRHIQDIIDALALIFYLQGLTVIPFAAADLAGHINIRKEMHLNLNDTVTGAGLAPSALYIKAETAFIISSGLGVRGGCKKVTNQVKCTGIGRRIGSGCPSNRGLVNGNDLI